MILAPRHPERFAEVATLVEGLGFRMLRRSLWSGEPFAGSVFLLDSIGELATVYSLATIAFVGGSLVPRGGHNILEPALYGVPIVTGNHYENFRDVVNFFAARQCRTNRWTRRVAAGLYSTDRKPQRTNDTRPECVGSARIATRRHRQDSCGSPPVDGDFVTRSAHRPLAARDRPAKPAVRSRRAACTTVAAACGQRREFVGWRLG